MSSSFSISIGLKFDDHVLYYVGLHERFPRAWSSVLAHAYRFPNLKEALYFVDSLESELSHPGGFTLFPAPHRLPFTVFQGFRLELVPQLLSPSDRITRLRR